MSRDTTDTEEIFVGDEIHILGDTIPTTSMRIPIDQLHYYADNPRIYTKMEQKDLSNKSIEETDEEIYELMRYEPSVTNIQDSIKNHGGLLEPIIVRRDTNVVVEGNSRLTVYKKFKAKDQFNENWQTIPCKCVSSLTDVQVDAFLNEIQVISKTPWTPYERAKLLWKKHHEDGISIGELKDVRFKGIQEKTIYNELWIIDAMKKNNDDIQSHYSHYERIRKTAVNREVLIENTNPERQAVLDLLFKKIKNDQSETKIKAKDIRDKLPVILESKKYTKKFLKTENLQDTYELAKTTDPDKKLINVVKILEDIKIGEVNSLTSGELGKLEYTYNKKLKKVFNLIGKWIEESREQN